MTGGGWCRRRGISHLLRCPYPPLRATPERASLVSAPQEWEGKERTSFAPRPINGREKKRRVSLASRMARRDRGGAGDWLAVWRFEIERGCSFLSLPRSSWGGWRGAPGGVTRARTKTAPTRHIVRAAHDVVRPGGWVTDLGFLDRLMGNTFCFSQSAAAASREAIGERSAMPRRGRSPVRRNLPA